MSIILLFICSYLIGSIPFAWMVGKYLGNVDLRKLGSGNLGTTNVARNLGVKKGALCFILDMLKGFIVFLVAKNLYDSSIGMYASLFCVLGHCFSIFMKLKGGKGVATSLGIFLAMRWYFALLIILVLLIALLFSRRMSIASLSAFTFNPLIANLLNADKEYLYLSLILFIFIFFTHRQNIDRILKGEEKHLF